jgi:DNA-binding response OmpR family regulator
MSAVVEGSEEEVVEVGPLRMLPEGYTATLNGDQLPLTFKEFKLLLLLARNAGRVVRRENIVREIWEGRSIGRSLDLHIVRLRKRLPPGAIETMVKVGYRLRLD